MVSIRRRKLLGLCNGRNTFPDDYVAVSVHPLPLDDGYRPKEERAFESSSDGSPYSSVSSPSKERPFKQFPEFKGRKRHRRKHVGKQEACTMRGVYYKNKKWQAAIKVDKKQIHLGTVGSVEEAARLYDRAAFMCGREPNFELSEEEIRELGNYKWDEFLAITRSAIANKSKPEFKKKKIVLGYLF